MYNTRSTLELSVDLEGNNHTYIPIPRLVDTATAMLLYKSTICDANVSNTSRVENEHFAEIRFWGALGAD